MIIGVVDKLVKEYRTYNPAEICQALNIRVLTEPLGNIRGYYQYCARNKFIHINNALHGVDGRFVLAHELGHAVLHPHMNAVFLQRSTYFLESRYESEADIFATCLILKTLDNAELVPTTFCEVSAMTGVPQEYIKKLLTE